MLLLVENRKTKTQSYMEFKEVPKKGDIFDIYKVSYSGYGDIIKDSEEYSYQEWTVIIKELTFFEKILKKLRFFDYF